MNSAELLRNRAENNTPEVDSGATPLARHIERQITATGPISFGKYMELLLNGAKLSDGSHIPGFYTQEYVPIGDKDTAIPKDEVAFYTSPERTPLFGMTASSQILEMYDILGQPDDFRIVEMGAGNGTLAHDILHGIKYFSQRHGRDLPKLRYTIVEQSDTLARKQKSRLSQFNEFPKEIVQGSSTDLPLGRITGVILSNELPDAFPVELVRKNADTFEQMYVAAGNEQVFAEVWQSPTEELREFLDVHDPHLHDNGVPYPYNKGLKPWMREISRVLDRGFAITIDYDELYTLCGLSDERKVQTMRFYAPGIGDVADTAGMEHILSKKFAGKGDVTTGIDFHLLQRMGQSAGLKTEGYTTQAGFLFSLGYHGLKRDIPRTYPHGVGDRRFRNYAFLDEEMLDPGFKVLIQSKGVSDGSHLTGMDWVITSEKDKKFFTPLPGQEVTVWEK